MQKHQLQQLVQQGAVAAVVMGKDVRKLQLIKSAVVRKAHGSDSPIR